MFVELNKLFDSSYANSSMTGWVRLLENRSLNPQLFPFIIHSLWYSCESRRRLLFFFFFVFGLHIKDFYLELRPLQLFGRRSLCLAATASSVSQRLDVNAANYPTQCHTAGPVMSTARGSPAAQPCWVSTRRGIWCDYAIRTPVRRSDA